MAKANPKGTKQPLGDGASDIFKQDLSVKPGHFPELDDVDYPAKLKEELQKDKQQREKEEKDCPPVTARRRRQRGFHKYRTAAYIHDQGQLGKNGRDHYRKRPDYGEETLKAAVGITEKTREVLSSAEKWKKAMAFPQENSPPKYERGSRLFLLQNINRPNGKLALKQVMKEATQEQLERGRKHLLELLAQKRDEGLYLTGAWFPYRWTAHHLIPHELLTEAKLGATGYQLLMESGYDVNNGHNGIITPACSWAVPMHCVIQHKSNHPAYSEFVMGELVNVKKTLDALAAQVEAQKDNPQDHKTVVADVLDRLTKLEDRLWQRMLALSRRVVPEAMRGNQSQTPHVSFARGKSVFPFGVLS